MLGGYQVTYEMVSDLVSFINMSVERFTKSKRVKDSRNSF